MWKSETDRRCAVSLEIYDSIDRIFRSYTIVEPIYEQCTELLERDLPQKLAKAKVSSTEEQLYNMYGDYYRRIEERLFALACQHVVELQLGIKRNDCYFEKKNIEAYREVVSYLRKINKNKDFHKYHCKMDRWKTLAKHVYELYERKIVEYLQQQTTRILEGKKVQYGHLTEIDLNRVLSSRNIDNLSKNLAELIILTQNLTISTPLERKYIKTLKNAFSKSAFREYHVINDKETAEYLNQILSGLRTSPV